MLKSCKPWAVLLLALLLCLAQVEAQAEDSERVVLIGHPDVSATLDAAQLRAVYTMRLKTWPSGQPIRVFTLPDGAALHIRFAEQRLRIWLRNRHKVRSWRAGYRRFPQSSLYTSYGLYKVPVTAGWTKAKGVCLL